MMEDILQPWFIFELCLVVHWSTATRSYFVHNILYVYLQTPFTFLSFHLPHPNSYIIVDLHTHILWWQLHLKVKTFERIWIAKLVRQSIYWILCTGFITLVLTTFQELIMLRVFDDDLMKWCLLDSHFDIS